MEQGRLDNGAGVSLAWQRVTGRHPSVVFLPGFRSDMTGDKARSLITACQMHGQTIVCFDYSGHGASDGEFTDGSIGRWTNDALAVIDRLTSGLVVLVGSSMGGWLALLIALARPNRIAGLLGIAAAPDFTEALLWRAFSPGQHAELMERGEIAIPSVYGDPTPITQRLIEEGRTHLLLQGEVAITCPVRLLHGQRDADVPWHTALTLAEQLRSDDVQLTLVKDGDHRLSRPSDLQLIWNNLLSLLSSQYRP